MNSTLKVLVVEDKAILAHDIVDRLTSFGYRHIIGPYSSGEDVLSGIKEEQPHIAILDIQLKGTLSGIDLAIELNKDNYVPVIYLTNQQDDRVFEESIKTMPVAFLNKPFTNNELRVAMYNASLRHNVDPPQLQVVEEQVLNDRIFIRSGPGKFHIMLDDILWVKSNGGDTSSIMTVDKIGQGEMTLPVVSLNLAKLAERLSFYPYLMRASRFYIINTRRVERIIDHHRGTGTTTKKAVIIANNEIVLGNRYRKSITDQFCQI